MKKCKVPKCLRGVENKGDVCKKCVMGMPPMENPQSPYAYYNKPSGGRTIPKADIKPEKPPSDKIVQELKPKKTADRQQQKEAVKMIYKSYWFGWPNGTPAIFKELFAQYGEFISDRTTPSKMTGNPNTHKSTINASGIAPMQIVIQLIFPQEGERGTYQYIENNHMIQEALNESGESVPTTHAIEMVKNDGEAFTFTKANPNGLLYQYEDSKGKVWKIPRWAIA